MTKINTVGDYFRENILLDGDESPITGTDPVIVYGPEMGNLDGVSVQIVAEETRSFMIAPGDAVVSATKTWTFANGNFGSGDVGGTFTIAGSVADDGTYTIDSVTDATTIVSTEAVASDETFDTSAVTISMTDPDLVATVAVEVSNDFVASRQPSLNQLPNAGHWSDISTAFSPAVGSISGAGDQFCQASPLVAKRLRVVITPASGAAAVWVLFAGRGNR